jgi:putative peptidoglycan lipid II flippase
MQKYIKKYFNSFEDKIILKAMTTLLIFVFLAKIAGLLKEVLIAWHFGISPEVDAFNLTFSFVQFPVSLFSSVIGFTLIPLVSKIRSQESDVEIKLFRSELLGLTFILSIIIMFLVYIVLVYLLDFNTLGLEPIQSHYVKGFLPYLVFGIPLGFIITLFSTWTMSSQRHVNTFLEAMPALSIIVFVFFWKASISMIYGLLLGYLLQALILSLILHQHNEIELPKFNVTSPNWTHLLKGIAFMILGHFFFSLMGLIDQYFAAGLGVGALSTLSFAEKILGIFLSLGIVVIGRAVLPIFSDAHNEGRSVRFIALKWALIIFIAGILISLLIIGNTERIVKIIFERGNFNMSDTVEVSKLLRLSSLQIPFYISGMVLSYAIASFRIYKFFVFVNFFLLIIKIISINYFVDHGYEISSLPISTVIVYMASFLTCLAYIYKYQR